MMREELLSGYLPLTPVNAANPVSKAGRRLRSCLAAVFAPAKRCYSVIPPTPLHFLDLYMTIVFLLISRTFVQ